MAGIEDALSTLGGANPVSAGLAVGQTVFGVAQAISGNSRMKRYLSQRRAFVTPDEVYKTLQATENYAQQGYDPFTLNYLTDQTDRAYGDAVGDINRLGGDPNAIAALFDRRMQATMKIGAENHAKNLENFSRYLGALDLVGRNKEAEWQSQQDILKDKIQSAASDKQAGVQNIFGGANAFTANMTAGKEMQLYKDRTDALAGGDSVWSTMPPPVNEPIETSGVTGTGDMMYDLGLQLLKEKYNRPR